jgi:hypothetical protein
MASYGVGYRPKVKTLSASFTRPANTTQYTAKDAVGTATTNVLTFTGASSGAGQGGQITKVSILSDNITVTTKSFRLHFYTSAPTAIADNAVNTVLYANAANYVGYVDLPASGTLEASGTGGGSYATVKVDPPLAYVTTTTGQLYGALEAIGAYTPASAEQFTVRVTVEQYT